MPGHAPIIRWLKLVLACVALVMGSTPAQALPEAEAVVSVLERRAPAEQRAEAVASVRGSGRVEMGHARVHVHAPFAGRIPEVRLPNRALLH